MMLLVDRFGVFDPAHSSSMTSGEFSRPHQEAINHVAAVPQQKRLSGCLLLLCCGLLASEAHGAEPDEPFIKPAKTVNATWTATDTSDAESTPNSPQRGDVFPLLEQVAFELRTEGNAQPEPLDDDTDDKNSTDRAASSKSSTGSKAEPSGESVELEEGGDASPFAVKFRWQESSMDWVFRGEDNGLGMFSLKSGSSRDFDLNDPSRFDIEFGYGIHFLSGPLSSDMPPRLFDLYFNVHWLKQLGDGFGFDANFDLGLFTDFEDSVRDGWRFPGRAIGFWNLNGADTPSEFTLVAGIEFFDTDRYGVVPAGGLIWQPDETARFEIYFPRPQVKLLVLQEEEAETWLYVRGELLGTAWAIERSDGRKDVANLSERRVALGLESRSLKEDGHTQFIEVGYVFDRKLEYQSGRGDIEPHDALMFRFGSRF